MSNTTTHNVETDCDPGARWVELAHSMAGFEGLITAVQGLLVGFSLATGEIWHTGDIETTLAIAERRMAEFGSMTAAWGIQQ
jgi:hypothetical protein